MRYRITPGKKPASATPRKKRAAYSGCGVLTRLVAMVTRPHRIMIRVMVRRAPTRCMYRLLGTSNSR
ncbi:hypothetical protein D9M71_781150 [compost metagenome]